MPTASRCECGRSFQPGISGGAGLCARCYQRRRRGTRALVGEVLRLPVGERMEQVTLYTPPRLAEAIRKAAAADDMHPSRWLRRFLSSALGVSE